MTGDHIAIGARRESKGFWDSRVMANLTISSMAKKIHDLLPREVDPRLSLFLGRENLAILADNNDCNSVGDDDDEGPS